MNDLISLGVAFLIWAIVLTIFVRIFRKGTTRWIGGDHCGFWISV